MYEGGGEAVSYITSFLQGLLLPAGSTAAVLYQARRYLEATAGPVPLD